jgi:hypothetical protein
MLKKASRSRVFKPGKMLENGWRVSTGSTTSVYYSGIQQAEALKDDRHGLARLASDLETLM